MRAETFSSSNFYIQYTSLMTLLRPVQQRMIWNIHTIDFCFVLSGFFFTGKVKYLFYFYFSFLYFFNCKESIQRRVSLDKYWIKYNVGNV